MKTKKENTIYRNWTPKILIPSIIITTEDSLPLKMDAQEWYILLMNGKHARPTGNIISLLVLPKQKEEEEKKEKEK